MAGYAKVKWHAAVSVQTWMLSFATGVDLCSKYRIKGKALLWVTRTSRAVTFVAMETAIFSLLSKQWHCYWNILVYLAMSHMQYVSRTLHSIFSCNVRTTNSFEWFIANSVVLWLSFGWHFVSFKCICNAQSSAKLYQKLHNTAKPLS